MRETFTFHAKMDARGKLQIPKREYEAVGWKKGLTFKVTIKPIFPEHEKEKTEFAARTNRIFEETKNVTD